MTARQMYDFAIAEVAFYEKQIDFDKGQIEYYGREIKRSRSEDRDLAAFALREKPDDPLTLRVFGGKYVSGDTRRLVNMRAHYYRQLKKDTARAAHFRQEAEDFARFIG